MLRPEDFFKLQDARIAELFAGYTYVWQVLGHIEDHVNRLVGKGQTLLGEVQPGAYISQRPVYIAPGAVVEAGAYVLGPAYIGPGAVLRHGAYVRENVILLDGAVLGHASEAKNSLFLPQAAAPHFNYVGDSVLGHHVNLGAGTKLSNLGILSEKDPLTGKRPSIHLIIEGQEYDTGLAKFGAILGDNTQTGCNAVLNPGCVVGPDTLIYANVSLRKGYHPGHSIIKLRQNVRRIDKINR